MKVFLWTVLVVWGATITFYILFMMFAAYNTARKAGIPIPRTTYVLLGPVVVVGFVLDVIWNCTVGSLLFLEFPPSPTFTGRLKSWKGNMSWRGRQAAWWASLLNPFDVGHV